MPQPMTTDEVRTSQPLTTADRLGILDLFARYAWAYDGGDAQAYAETFATDGVLADENDLRAVGPSRHRGSHQDVLRHARTQCLSAAPQRPPSH